MCFKRENILWTSKACLKFMFSKKATKIDEIFTVDLTVTTYCQIDGEDFFNFCGLLRKRELYKQGFQKCFLFENLHFGGQGQPKGGGQGGHGTPSCWQNS